MPGAALATLNDLVGGMSPYGRSGAQALIESVSEVGASYFATVSRETGRPWLAVIPLADAVTLPACPWPPNVIFIDAFHGGLLGDRSVQQLVEAFLASGTVPDGTGRPGGRLPAGPAQRGSAHRGRGLRLADAGPALGLPLVLAAPRPGWPERPAIRYAMPRDANSSPSVVAPPLGGVLIRVPSQATAQERRPLSCFPAASGA